jgi:hypothetical protein
MIGELVAVGMGMGVVTGGKYRFCLRVVGGMRCIRGVVPFSINVAFLVLPG